MDYSPRPAVICWFLGLCLFPALLTAQCPPDGAVSSAVAGDNLSELRRLARTLMACSASADSLSLVQHTLGTKYSRTDLDSAVHFTRLAVENREATDGAKGSIPLGKSNYNLGEFLRRQGRFTEAERYLKRSLIVFEELVPNSTGAPRRALRAHTALQQTYTGLGAYGRAEEASRLVLDRARRLRDTISVAYGLYDRAALSLSQNNFAEAADAYTALGDSLARWRSVAADPLSGWLKGLEPYRNHNLGVCLTETGDHTAAEAAYHRAIPVFEQWGDYDNLSRAYHDLAYQRMEAEDLPAAKRLLQKEKAAAERSGLPRNLAYHQNNQGDYLLRNGEYQSAATAFQNAQVALLPGYEPGALIAIPSEALIGPGTDLPYLLENLLDQARALTHLAKAEPELSGTLTGLYRTADLVVDRLRTDQGTRVGKLFWREKVLPLYEAAVANCTRNGDGEAAYYFFEKSKAVLLHESLLANNALGALPDSLRFRERQLRAAITYLSGSDGPGKAARLVGLRDQLQRLQQRLREAYPEYAAVNQTANVPSLNDYRARSLSHGRQTHLQYLWGDERLYALVLEEADARVYDLGAVAELDTLVRSVLAYFAAPSAVENAPLNYARSAYAVYQKILAPLGLSPNGHLVITPDGPLTYLPFVALLTAETDRMTFGDWPFLLRERPVSYCHSAGVQLAAGGPVSEPVAVTAFAPFTDGTSRLDLPVLTFSDDELKAVGKRFATTLYRDAAADARTLLHGQGAGVLHLSSHAFSSPEEDKPYLALYDRAVYLDELYTVDLPAEMVVLSACQSNVGKLARGEGVLGLGRGFVQAGAASVVASLWNVNARAGGAVLTNFYDELAAGSPRATALGNAQLRYLSDPGTRDRGKNPYLWAGLTYYGPDLPLPLQRRSASWPRWVAGGVLLAGLAFVFRRARRSGARDEAA